MTDKYKIEDMMDQNQSFVSYKVLNTELGNQHILKRYLVDDASGIGKIPNWQTAFMTIVDEFSTNDSPHLRTLNEGSLDQVDGNPFAAFEWLEANDLEYILEENIIERNTASDMISSVLTALDFMHNKGIEHSSISPKSILYTESNAKNSWVLDWDPVKSLRCKFGVNRFDSDYYTAPELLSGSYASVQSDLFAVGRTMRTALGDAQLNSALTIWLDKLDNSKPEKRFVTASQALDELRQLDLTVVKLITAPVPFKSPALSAPVAVKAPSIETQKTNTRATSQPVYTKSKSKGTKVAVGSIAALVTLGLITFFLIPKKKNQSTTQSSPNETSTIQAPKTSHDTNPVILSSDDYNVASKYLDKTVIVEGTVRAITNHNFKNKYEVLLGGELEKHIHIIGNKNSAFNGFEIHLLKKHFKNTDVRAIGRLILIKGKYFIDLEYQGGIHRTFYPPIKYSPKTNNNPNSTKVDINDRVALQKNLGKIVSVTTTANWATFIDSNTSYRLICMPEGDFNTAFHMEGKVDNFFQGHNLPTLSRSYVGSNFTTSGRLQFNGKHYTLDLDDEELIPSN